MPSRQVEVADTPEAGEPGEEGACYRFVFSKRQAGVR